jgi:hypothetical protein
VMVIEHAERFGLAKLHQLRGRVGRGARASSCLLLYDEPLTASARARLEILRATDDGFRIAEEDLRLRGPGELLGTRQSGLPALRLADLTCHADLLAPARKDARKILELDPGLHGARGHALRVLLRLFGRDDAPGSSAAGPTTAPERSPSSSLPRSSSRDGSGGFADKQQEPEVGLGVLGKKTFTISSRRAPGSPTGRPADDADGAQAAPRTLDQDGLAKGP